MKIARDIRKNILTGKWKPQQQLPNREDLVVQYNTSKATMQKTINELLREGFIHTTNKSGTFVAETPPNLYSIAIVFPVKQPDSIYTDSLWTGIQRQHYYMEEHFGRRFIFCRFYNSNVEHEEFQKVIEDAESLRLAGIIFSDEPSPQAVNALRHLNTPRVAVTSNQVLSFNRVNVNFDMFFNMAMEHLRRCGRSRLAVISNPEMPPSHIAQCRNIAASHGISMPPEWELAVNLTANPDHWSRNLVRLLFKTSPELRPDGLIVANENLFEYVLNALQYENITPGEDIDIVVHTNFPTNRPKPCRMERIGFDVRDIIESCIEAIEESGTDNSPLPLKLVNAVTEKSNLRN